MICRRLFQQRVQKAPKLKTSVLKFTFSRHVCDPPVLSSSRVASCSSVSYLIGIFEPSRPLEIISGPKETFINRYVVERTSKAETRQEEQSKKTQSCLGGIYGMKYS